MKAKFEDGQEGQNSYSVEVPRCCQGVGEKKADEEIAVGDKKFKCTVTTIVQSTTKLNRRRRKTARCAWPKQSARRPRCPQSSPCR